MDFGLCVSASLGENERFPVDVCEPLCACHGDTVPCRLAHVSIYDEERVIGNKNG